MRRADRLFQIIQLLRTRRVLTARQLAEKLEVSMRTVYRDIADLFASGVPIEGEAGIGYALRRGYDLPPLMFDKEEILALALGARIVQSWADPKLAAAAERALDRIQLVLPEKLKPALLGAYLHSPAVLITREAAQRMEQLRNAIDTQHKVRFDYVRADQTASARTVWPLGLFFWSTGWTLGAWCELRKSLRNFRIDRMTQVETLDETYTPEPGRRLDDLLRIEKETTCFELTVMSKKTR
ncbi:MAG: YafY family transcriptional regulator [Gammaproteobacteria bacterium]|nr:YafY family transcriptional regulator [Gammaproteobacteria bacterium]